MTQSPPRNKSPTKDLGLRLGEKAKVRVGTDVVQADPFDVCLGVSLFNLLKGSSFFQRFRVRGYEVPDFDGQGGRSPVVFGLDVLDGQRVVR